MKVKDVIISALNLLCRRDVAVSMENGETLSAEEADTAETLLYCFNAVEDEVARKYMPLTATERFRAVSGIFRYTNFAHAPVKIKRVTSGGKEVEFELLTEYMAVNAEEITVEYEYAPSKKTIDGDSDFGDETGEYLLALGVAAEYCLINGEIESAEIWEKKYRTQIDAAQSRLPSGGTIPPRRWV